MVGLVANTRVNGTITQNPFQFQGYDLQQLTLRHGSDIVNGEVIKPKSREGGLLKAYTNLLDGKESFFTNKDIGISFEEFTADRRFYCFTLSPDMEVDGIAQPRKSGGMTLDLSFSTPLPNAINVVIMGKFDNIIFV